MHSLVKEAKIVWLEYISISHPATPTGAAYGQTLGEGIGLYSLLPLSSHTH